MILAPVSKKKRSLVLLFSLLEIETRASDPARVFGQMVHGHERGRSR